MRSVLLALVVLMLAGCASQPSNIGNTCSVFEQNDGWFNNWRRAAYSAEREYGVPVPILMATMYVESGFRARARPPRSKLFGFIPWTRKSSAYGYAQALDGTWDQYVRETGHVGARRADFSDAVRFVAWYHSKSNRTNGIALNDPYNLYLAYYSGHAGYRRGTWRSNQGVQDAARRATDIANKYAMQLRSCR